MTLASGPLTGAILALAHRVSGSIAKDDASRGEGTADDDGGENGQEEHQEVWAKHEAKHFDDFPSRQIGI